MKIISLLLLVLFLGFSNLPANVESKGISYVEGISFELKTIALEHQGPNVVDLKVHFNYMPGLKDKEYPDFEPLQPFGATFLKDYPNNGDYWEVVVKKLATAFLEKTPSIASVTIELQVYPTKTVAYFHTIHCTATREK